MTETPKCIHNGAPCCRCMPNGPCTAPRPTKKMPVEAFSAALHRAEPDASYQQLSKALCGKGNAALDELLEAKEQLKQRAEPELRPLTLDEIKNRCKSPLQAETLFIEFKRGWKSYRFWPRKPTPEQMEAEKWEE